MAPPNAAPRAATARERVRAELSREIKEEARRQLAASGAGGLSLRAVARELGMVSSALYRYYPSRDDLLTALIIDAYDALGDAAEGAIAAGTAACHAVRDWARANPHEYALVYGSPVPGGAALPPDVLVRAVIAWTQLYGMISFELFGQFIGSFEPADALFAHTAQQLAAFVGLR